jgi:hypothetical protein
MDLHQNLPCIGVWSVGKRFSQGWFPASFMQTDDNSARRRSIESALIAAEKNQLDLVFEPESENVANSASRARELLDELGNPRLRIIIDPPNLQKP